MTDTRTSWPLAIVEGDRPLWHVAGTNPPLYERDEKLEAIYMEAQQRLKAPRKIIQLELWEKAA